MKKLWFIHAQILFDTALCSTREVVVKHKTFKEPPLFDTMMDWAEGYCDVCVQGILEKKSCRGYCAFQFLSSKEFYDRGSMKARDSCSHF